MKNKANKQESVPVPPNDREFGGLQCSEFFESLDALLEKHGIIEKDDTFISATVHPLASLEDVRFWQGTIEDLHKSNIGPLRLLLSVDRDTSE